MQLRALAQHPGLLLSVLDDLRFGRPGRGSRGPRPPGEDRHRCGVADADRGLPRTGYGFLPGHVALMARLDKTVATKWLARLIAFGAVAAALALAAWTLYVVDARPRTHNAH